MRAQTNVPFRNISATTAAFELKGGAYTLDLVATGSGTVTLQRLGPDGSTYITADPAAALTANGTTGAMALPQGLYRVNIATFTAVYVNITRVPGE